jgi:hypothetical protein
VQQIYLSRYSCRTPLHNLLLLFHFLRLLSLFGKPTIKLIIFSLPLLRRRTLFGHGRRARRYDWEVGARLEQGRFWSRLLPSNQLSKGPTTRTLYSGVLLTLTMSFNRGSYFRGSVFVRILKFRFTSGIDLQLMRRMFII